MGYLRCMRQNQQSDPPFQKSWIRPCTRGLNHSNQIFQYFTVTEKNRKVTILAPNFCLPPPPPPPNLNPLIVLFCEKRYIHELYYVLRIFKNTIGRCSSGGTLCDKQPSNTTTPATIWKCFNKSGL